MAESTLTAAYKDLTGDVGFFLGFGRGADNGDTAWDTEQQKAIDRCVKGGLRSFYYCGHPWSFLQPVATLTLASGATTVTLPDDFGGFEGKLVISSPTDQGWYPLELVPIGDVYRQETRFSSSTGWPEMACLEPLKTTTATRGQPFQLHVWPTADQEYSLKGQYYILPDYLSGAFPYAYGGAMHAETLLASCKAVAELDLDDMGGGPQAASFAQKLSASIDLDRRNKPQTIGYNADRSDGRDRRGDWHDRNQTDQSITFGGVLYGG